MKENGAEAAVRREEKTEDAPKEAHDEKATETPSIREAAAMPAEEQVKLQATESDAADALFAEIFAEKPREESISIDILPEEDMGKTVVPRKETSAAEEEIPIAMMEEETVEETQAEEAEESEEAAEAEEAKPAADKHEPRKETAPVEEERPYIFSADYAAGKRPADGQRQQPFGII